VSCVSYFLGKGWIVRHRSLGVLLSRFYILCVAHVQGILCCVHQIEMSLFLPFRNVTVIGVGDGRARSPPRSAVDGSAFADACDHATVASIVHNRNVSRPSVIP
jgi:hypothetical protein